MSSFSSSSGLFQMLLPLPPSKKRTWKLLVAGSRLHTHSLPLLPVCLFSFFLSAGKLKRKLVGALGSLSSCLYIVFPGAPPPFPVLSSYKTKRVGC